MTNHLDVVHVKNETTSSWSIELGLICDES